jgi:hypothetical protein
MFFRRIPIRRMEYADMPEYGRNKKTGDENPRFPKAKIGLLAFFPALFADCRLALNVLGRFRVFVDLSHHDTSFPLVGEISAKGIDIGRNRLTTASVAALQFIGFFRSSGKS